MLYDNDTFEHGGKTFKVTFPDDDDTTPPWERDDGHGPVSDWTSRAKRPGEWVLSDRHGSKRFYDAQEAAKIARREWVQASPGVTLGQAAVAAVAADFEVLRTWCADQWGYVGCVVTLLDEEGEPTDRSDSIWGLESNSKDYLETTAHELAAQIIATQQHEEDERLCRELLENEAREKATQALAALLENVDFTVTLLIKLELSHMLGRGSHAGQLLEARLHLEANAALVRERYFKST